MQLVININERLYKIIKSLGLVVEDEDAVAISEAIRKGTPLPEVPGRLIILSEDVVKREQIPLSFSCQNWISEFGLSSATVAIIKAEREEV